MNFCPLCEYDLDLDTFCPGDSHTLEYQYSCKACGYWIILINDAKESIECLTGQEFNYNNITPEDEKLRNNLINKYQTHPCKCQNNLFYWVKNAFKDIYPKVGDRVCIYKEDGSYDKTFITKIHDINSEISDGHSFKNAVRLELRGILDYNNISTMRLCYERE